MEDASKPTYWACWWRTTWVLFLLGCLLGYANNGEAGFARAIGRGIIVAPLSSLFWGWIYWLIKR